MPVEELAREHYAGRLSIARRAARELAALWARVDPDRIAASWTSLLGRATAAVGAAQLLAASEADGYVAAALAEQGLEVDADGVLIPSALAGVASDGRDLGTLLAEPAVTSLTRLARGADLASALTAGGVQLDMIVRTQVADAGRVADGVATVVRPRAGYVRMLSLPSCSRCIVLAGRYYEFNAGFDRHPRCDCVHIPCSEDRGDDLRTDPKQAFRSMSAADQDRVFTKAGAEAIRLGADIGQVVNARRGAAGLTPAGARITDEEARLLRGGKDVGRLATTRIYGQDVFITTEGTTTRGVAGNLLGARETLTKASTDRYRRASKVRLMPESILAAANGDRDMAVKLLKRFGYLRP